MSVFCPCYSCVSLLVREIPAFIVMVRARTSKIFLGDCPWVFLIILVT